jgi:hypothetical protein
LRELRQSKIEDLDASIFGDEKYFPVSGRGGRFLFVRRRQPMRDLHSILDGLALRQSAAVQRRAQAIALQKFGDQKG